MKLRSFDSQLEDNFAVCLATINRPHCVQKLVRSVRKYYPRVDIFVGDQSPRSELQSEFYRRNNVNVTWLPHDCGVTAARNHITGKVKQKYIVLCDDDFVFVEDNNINDAIYILDNEPNLGVLGGRLIDVWRGTDSDRYWELYLNLDRKHRLLSCVSIYNSAPTSRLVGNFRYFKCDAVTNWFVARSAMFRSGIMWDEQFKSNGEHEDFFLNIKENSYWDVGYYPGLLVRHEPPERQRYARLRNRSDGWLKFMNKWGIDQMMEVGSYVRTRAQPDVDITQLANRASFFLSGDLLRNREYNINAKGVVLQGDDKLGVIASNIFNSIGSVSSRDQVTFGRLVLLDNNRIASNGLIESKEATAKSSLDSISSAASSRIALAVPRIVDAREDLIVWLKGYDGIADLLLTITDLSDKFIYSINISHVAVASPDWSASRVPVPMNLVGEFIVRIFSEVDNELVGHAIASVSFLSPMIDGSTSEGSAFTLSPGFETMPHATRNSIPITGWSIYSLHYGHALALGPASKAGSMILEADIDGETVRALFSVDFGGGDVIVNIPDALKEIKSIQLI